MLVSRAEGRRSIGLFTVCSPRINVLDGGFRVTGFDTTGLREPHAKRRRERRKDNPGRRFFVGRFWGRTGPLDGRPGQGPWDPRPANPQTTGSPHGASRSSMVLLHARTTISIADSNPPSYRFIASMRKGQHLRRIRHEIVIVVRLAREKTPVNMGENLRRSQACRRTGRPVS